MQSTESSSPGFVRNRLPLILGAVALLVYLVTLNRWVRLESLPFVARITGWDWTPPLQAPLTYLLTLPFHWLPASVAPVMLNGLSAVLAGLTLATLARCVALLPFDRTREARTRERSEDGLLSIPLAWLPPVVAVALCGFQLTFWEHATAATGEMLDLFLFAGLVRCLLEFRHSGREGWLTGLALLYGFAATNNYALIAFFPCFLTALVWIKGFEFFRMRFMLRMLGLGLIGLIGYLILPLVGMMHGGELTFWQYLRAVLGSQKQSLLSFPPYATLLIVLQCLVPVLILGIRTRPNPLETSAAGATTNAFIVRGIQVLMLALCVSAFLDLKWGPRYLGLGTAMLPFFFLAALGAGYYTGYLLLIGQQVPGRSWRRESGLLRLVAQAGMGLALVVAVAGPGWLIYQNLPAVRRNDGRALGQMAEMMVGGLPAEGVCLLSDGATELLLAEAALSRRQAAHPHLLIHTGFLPYHRYHARLAERDPARWRALTDEERRLNPEPLPSQALNRFIHGLARSNTVYYLHPSVGSFFEEVALEQQGLIFRLTLLPDDPDVDPPVTPERVALNQKIWTDAAPVLAALPRKFEKAEPGTDFLRQTYSRALNHWAVTLQRQGALREATPWFETALALAPESDQARVNLAFNQDLLKGLKPVVDLEKPLQIKANLNTWEQLLNLNGPFDHPAFVFRVGQVLARGGLYWQALRELRRAAALLPDHIQPALWRDNMEAMVRFTRGDVEGAEKRALALTAKHPREDGPLETLTQIYMMTGRFAETQASTRRQLELNPSNVAALLNAGLTHIRLKNYPEAIVLMDRLLGVVPNHTGGLFNRGIAELLSGDLEAANRDYTTLLQLMPNNPAIYYGLGEIARQRQQREAALEAYGRYLELGEKGTEEYDSVTRTVADLKAGK